jgi:hypothetical protein
MQGDDRYATATAICPKPVGRIPRGVVHRRTAEDVQLAVRGARDGDLPLSVRGGGHDCAGRALCDAIVIDLSAMNGVLVAPNRGAVQIAGGSRASDVRAVTSATMIPIALSAPPSRCPPSGPRPPLTSVIALEGKPAPASLRRHDMPRPLFVLGRHPAAKTATPQQKRRPYA